MVDLETLKQAEDKILVQIEEHFGAAPDSIEWDNEYHVFGIDHSKTAGRYKADDLTGEVRVYDWHGTASMKIFTVEGCDYNSLSEEERAEIKAIRKARAEARQREQEQELKLIREEWKSFRPCRDTHAYLKLKKLTSAHGVMRNGEYLCWPFYSAEGEVMGYQSIGRDGKKSIRWKSKKGGSFGLLLPASEKVELDTPLIACEGFATACSIVEAVDAIVIICIDCGNMVHAIKSACTFMRRSVRDVLILADNDASGAGEKGAIEAVMKHGCRYELIPEVGMDANDYACKYGIDKLSEFIRGIL